MADLSKATPRPWLVERHDQDDGSINYEIWCQESPTYTRICTISENFDSNKAREDAALIVQAVNEREELLAALRELSEATNVPLQLVSPNVNASARLSAAIARARAALARAAS